MNDVWISDSHKSAHFFRSGQRGFNEKLQVIRVLDAIGMFETSWMIFNHSYNTERYGYSKR